MGLPAPPTKPETGGGGQKNLLEVLVLAPSPSKIRPCPSMMTKLFVARNPLFRFEIVQCAMVWGGVVVREGRGRGGRGKTRDKRHKTAEPTTKLGAHLIQINHRNEIKDYLFTSLGLPPLPIFIKGPPTNKLKCRGT